MADLDPTKLMADIPLLRIHSQMKRMKISTAIKEMMDYVLNNQDNDVLVSGFPSADLNPWKHSRKCTTL
ncbi:hypothetical protein SNEBB_009527 [Seison nebaliae]|nr:hypothetical protein SNEBB_009527 [Seison nebaliae]